MGLVVLFPVLNRRMLANARHVLVGQNHKLLVGGRLQEELVAALVQHTTQGLRGLNRLAANLKIQAIGKERLELHARQATFGQQRAMLLNARNGMSRSMHAAEHHGLAAQSTALGAADVEHVAQLRQLGQGDVAFVGRQRIGQAGTIHKQRNLALLAHRMNRRELGLGVQRAVFGRQTHVHGTREHRVLVALVLVKHLDVVFEIIGVHLALVTGDGEHLVAAKLDGACLMASNVAGLGGNDALVRSEQHIDHRRVGLRAAHQQEHIRVRRLAGLADKLLGTLGVRVGTVAGLRLHIGIDERLQHRRVCAVGIVVVEREHGNPLLPGIGQMIQVALIVRRADRQCARQGTQVPTPGQSRSSHRSKNARRSRCGQRRRVLRPQPRPKRPRGGATAFP